MALLSAEYTGEPPEHCMVSESHVGRLYIYWDEYKSNYFLHVRLWYYDRRDGLWKPTKKGVAIPAGRLKRFVEVLGVVLNERPE